MFKWLEKNLPKIVMAPAVGLIGWFVYGFVLWTLYISFTNSKILPKYELWGFGQYEKLWASRKWLIAVDNLLIFTALFLIFCVVIGIILAIFFRSKNQSRGFAKNDLFISNGAIFYRYRNRMEMDIKSNFRYPKNV